MKKKLPKSSIPEATSEQNSVMFSLSSYIYLDFGYYLDIIYILQLWSVCNILGQSLQQGLRGGVNSVNGYGADFSIRKKTQNCYRYITNQMQEKFVILYSLIRYITLKCFKLGFLKNLLFLISSLAEDITTHLISILS